MSINKEGISLNYLWGSAREVQQTLIEWSKDPVMKSQKYPCLILFTPVKVPREQGNNDPANVTPEIVIVTDTKKNYKSSERKQFIYEPILWPIYDRFMYYVKLSEYFNNNSSGRIPHTTVDRFYYSPTPAHEQNVFSAVLDAVEISDLELILKELTTESCYMDIVEKYVYRVTLDGGAVEAVDCIYTVINKLKE